MSTPTAADMAHWPAPNYVNPSTHGPIMIGVMSAFTLAMIPFVISRIHMRLRLKGKLGIDDWIILACAVSRV